jgi:hypoxanthine-guanine phosphoribosyltransferase
MGEGIDLSDQEVARIQEQIKTLFGDLREVKADVKELKDQLANRPPGWATLAISVLMGVCGFLAAKAF